MTRSGRLAKIRLPGSSPVPQKNCQSELQIESHDTAVSFPSPRSFNTPLFLLTNSGHEERELKWSQPCEAFFKKGKVQP